nr:putative zinc finger, CCHC-type [Tanacetum cinerariifolium]
MHSILNVGGDRAEKVDDDDEDLLKKRKSSQQNLKRRYEKGDPTVGLLVEPSVKFDYYVLYPKTKPSQPPSPPHKASSTSTSPPPLKLSPYSQKALSITHQDSPIKDKEVLSSPETFTIAHIPPYVFNFLSRLVDCRCDRIPVGKTLDVFGCEDEKLISMSPFSYLINSRADVDQIGA